MKIFLNAIGFLQIVLLKLNTTSSLAKIDLLLAI